MGVELHLPLIELPPKMGIMKLLVACSFVPLVSKSPPFYSFFLTPHYPAEELIWTKKLSLYRSVICRLLVCNLQASLIKFDLRAYRLQMCNLQVTYWQLEFKTYSFFFKAIPCSTRLTREPLCGDKRRRRSSDRKI